MKQNNISGLFLDKAGVNFRVANDEVAKLAERVGFQVRNEIQFSRWWNDEADMVGAATAGGLFKGIVAVLKVQFAPTHSSEQDLIRAFLSRARHLLIRPPKILLEVSRDEFGAYEAVIAEAYDELVVPVSELAQEQHVEAYFKAFIEYRKVLKSPFVEDGRASASQRISESFAEWKQIREILDVYKEVSKSDKVLIEEAVDYLISNYRDVPNRFCHGHFSARDLRKKGSEWVLLSNLYWGYRPPLYDLVFGWHWRRIDLINNGFSVGEIIKKEQPYWEKRMQHIANEIGEETHFSPDLLYRLARLERAVAGLNLDRFSVKESHKRFELAQLLRDEIVFFMQ
jgi:hypothetical protein